MKIGFTGTQIGMSLGQMKALNYELAKMREFGTDTIHEFHHGDCIGSDSEAHEIALWLGYQIVIHPPNNPIKRAYCGNWTHRAIEADYLVRNHNIVNSVEILIVAPKMNVEELRSGTWATYRYAKKMGKRIIMLEREDAL